MGEADRCIFIVSTNGEAAGIRDCLLHSGYAVIGTGSSVNEFTKLPPDGKIDCIIIDADHIAGRKEVAAAREALRSHGIPILILCSDHDGKKINGWLEAEPYGYIPRPYTAASIRSVLDVAFRRIELERYLLVSESKYRRIFEESKDAIFINDSHGAVIDYNNAMRELFDYDDDAMALLTVNDLYQSLDAVVDMYGRLEQDGFIKDMEVPLKRKNGEIIFGLIATSFLSEGDQGVRYYQNIIKEITPIKRRAMEELRESLKTLHDVMYGMIDTMTLVIEARDPYTAGHQREVSSIAVSIAEKMGLEGEQVEGIKVAALIHDIGKLSVPAEILSKPAKLTSIEYKMVSEHPEVGYSMLRPINFPWPVADIVRQHHERWDGSGYPQGLRGEDIMLEARIIRVADVVESMSSHRPYRPSMGIAAALAEIEANGGKKYDPIVVKACIAVFKDSDSCPLPKRRARE